jgi:rRNA maturation endonuclease Nob1
MSNKTHGSVEVGKHKFGDNSSVEEAVEESYQSEERVPLEQHMGEWNSAELQVSTSEQENVQESEACLGAVGGGWFDMRGA